MHARIYTCTRTHDHASSIMHHAQPHAHARTYTRLKEREKSMLKAGHAASMLIQKTFRGLRGKMAALRELDAKRERDILEKQVGTWKS